MRKINYPISGTPELKSFYRRYRKSFAKFLFRDVNALLKVAPDYDGSKLTFEELLTMPLEELMKVNEIFLPHLPLIKNKAGKMVCSPHALTALIDYGEHRDGIAKFFMKESDINLKICYYCGIDYINAFNDFGDYIDAVDFLNYASKKDLLKAYGVGTAKAQKIIKLRKVKKFSHINDAKLPKKTNEWLNKLRNYKNSYNHFTLDHILPKSRYKLLSLSIHNLVPCCFNCNSKFKKAEDLLINEHLVRVSPTASQYSLTDDFKFKVFYSGKLQNIIDTSNFSLRLSPLKNHLQLDRYIELFKLDGRYVAHKDQILELISKKGKHSKSQIYDMAKILKTTPRAVEEIIYGKELFILDHPSPLHKCKRDIAENIKIIR